MKHIVSYSGGLGSAITAKHICDEYLICNRHKYAKLIQKWSVTGQPVHVKVECERGNHLLDVSTGFYYFDLDHSVFITTAPDFNIPNAEYSFTEFKEEV